GVATSTKGDPMSRTRSVASMVRLRHAGILTLTSLLLICVSSPGTGAATKVGEFDFSEQHEAGDTPNRFLNELAYEHAYPAQPTHPYVRTIGRAKAYKAFQDVRFRGTGKGRPGTWRTVGPETVLPSIDPAMPGAAL